MADFAGVRATPLMAVRLLALKYPLVVRFACGAADRALLSAPRVASIPHLAE